MGWNQQNGSESGGGHTHANKSVLDKFGESGSSPTFNGTIIGGSGGSGGTVTTDTSGFFYERENLHDLNKELDGHINSSTGAVVASANKVTDFMPVTPSTVYISNHAKTIYTYDSNKAYLGTLLTFASDTSDFIYPRPYNIGSAVRFVRIVRGTHITNPMFMRGSVLPHEYLNPGIKQLWVSQNDFVKSLRLQTNDLYGLKWNVLGDSVTGGYNESLTDTTPVKTYHKVMASDYGLIATNHGIGGTKITTQADGKGFCQRYVSMSDDADIITVFGGINDYADPTNIQIGTFGSTDTTTIYGAMDVLCKGLLQKYPTKRLGFILPFPFNEYKGAGTWKPYQDAMEKVLNYYSIPYLDLNKESLLNANIAFINTEFFKDGDKTHPNTRGHAILARKIYAFLKTL